MLYPRPDFCAEKKKSTSNLLALADAGTVALLVVVDGGVAVLLLHLAATLTLDVLDGLHLVVTWDSLASSAPSSSRPSVVIAPSRCGAAAAAHHRLQHLKRHKPSLVVAEC